MDSWAHSCVHVLQIAVLKEMDAKGPFVSLVMGVVVLKDVVVIVLFALNMELVPLVRQNSSDMLKLLWHWTAKIQCDRGTAAGCEHMLQDAVMRLSCHNTGSCFQCFKTCIGDPCESEPAHPCNMPCRSSTVSHLNLA